MRTVWYILYLLSMIMAWINFYLSMREPKGWYEKLPSYKLTQIICMCVGLLMMLFSFMMTFMVK